MAHIYEYEKSVGNPFFLAHTHPLTHTRIHIHIGCIDIIRDAKIHAWKKTYTILMTKKWYMRERIYIYTHSSANSNKARRLGSWRKRTSGSTWVSKQKRGKNMNSTNFLHANEQRTESRRKHAYIHTHTHTQINTNIHARIGTQQTHWGWWKKREGKTKHSIRTNTLWVNRPC